MKHWLAAILLCSAATAASAQETGRQWQFGDTPIWQDEFSYKGAPDSSKWGYDMGGDGWGNHELQYYSKRRTNVFVRDGMLTIVARKHRTEDSDYTSARLVSRSKGDFKYGRFEFRARLPQGRGTWPALWMMPAQDAYGSWPRSGEIDIMEQVGHEPGQIHITVHTQAYNHRINTQRGTQTRVDTASSAFHRYRVDWTPDWIRGFVDDAQVFEFVNEGTGPEVWPFDQSFYLLMNIAVGGDWGGAQGVDDKSFPATMQIDYVRVYPLLGQ
jgi:beta-glucanase (GH16 family)